VDRFEIDARSTVPPSRQIVSAILDRIATRRLRPGDCLPSVRDLAIEVMVNPNTVTKAYRTLTLLGAVQAKPGLGSYVAEGASEICHRARRQSTLDDFRRAAQQALAAGQPAEKLMTLIERLSRSVVGAGTPE
jgi:GntR family transcriptional regulator